MSLSLFSWHGKVDHVRGLFYVKTRFVQIGTRPVLVLPLGSKVFIDDGTEQRGVAIETSGKSFAVVWLLILTVLVGVTGAILLLLLVTSKTMGHLAAGLILVAVAVGLWALTTWISRPSLSRAIELGLLVGIDENQVREACGLPPVEQPQRPRKRRRKEPAAADAPDTD